MGDIAALRGVWNIVPTPFTPDGAVDDASIPGLVAFVRATGVDGLTILGVLGEAGRLGDAERSLVMQSALEAADGVDPDLRRGVARVDRPGDRLRPGGRGRRCPLGHARPTAPRPPDGCRAPPPLPRGRGGDLDPDRGPGSPRELGRPDDVRLPPGPGGRGAAVPGDQAGGGADAAEGRAPRVGLGGRGGPGRARRGDADRGARPRDPRDHDGLRVPGGAGRGGAAVVRGRS